MKKWNLLLLGSLVSMTAIAEINKAPILDDEEPYEPEQALKEYSLPEQHGGASIRGEIPQEQQIDIQEVEKKENILNTNGIHEVESRRRYD